MPELPEVETIARILREGSGAERPPLVGRMICEARVLWPREVSGMSADAFVQHVAGRRVSAVSRHGKYLILELRGDAGSMASQSSDHRVFMLAHLRMSGRLDVVPQAEAFTPHARVVWLLDHGWALRFDDARKFGRVCLADQPSQVTGKLGPDALSVTAQEFTTRLLAKRGALKPILLDQRFIAGVGNIYADEALFLARLHPTRLASALDASEALRLHRAVRQVLLDGIAANGASFDWVYPGGNYQDHFRVYGRAGLPCVNCGQPISRILVGQRSTHFCAACQK
ncbi:MAG: DNA-formamidopyrimidine glycosylase [Candidatus Roseilinea sp.]|uniref:DNA-formamidopyrimidine glycosylase n=1 Tax=Candidatus Roseilinea sp. TaxID=2838777 RepID=UPI004049E2BF